MTSIIQALTPIILAAFGSTIAIYAIINHVTDSGTWTAVGSALGGGGGVATSAYLSRKNDEQINNTSSTSNPTANNHNN